MRATISRMNRAKENYLMRGSPITTYEIFKLKRADDGEECQGLSELSDCRAEASAHIGHGSAVLP